MGQITATFTNTVSTNMINSTSAVSYAAAHAGAGLSVNNFANVAGGGFRHSLSGPNYVIDRYFFHFDTSSIPENATIVSAFLRILGSNTSSANADSDGITLVASTVTSDTTLATSDWANIGATQFITALTFASFNTTGNNDLTLNASGLAAIVLNAHSKFAIITSRDLSSSAPTGLNNQTFDQSGTLLSVTYSVPDASGDFKFI